MREIRGWNIGEVVTANTMTLNTANIMEETGAVGESNLPCIYSGLTLQSQTGSGNSIVTFNPGECRCEDLPTSVYTYLPPNAYGTSYPCFIDISLVDSNTVITLTTSPTTGYIVATFNIAPTSSGAINYVITGSLAQIATGSYNPAIHVRLCSYNYTGSTFLLDFTPGTSRDTDFTGIGGIQWNYQNSSLVINTPASQSGSAITLNQNTTVNGTSTVTGNSSQQSASQMRFYNSGNTFYTSLQGGTNSTNVNLTLPSASGSVGQAIVLTAPGILGFGNNAGTRTDVNTSTTPINALTNSASFVRLTGSTPCTVNGIAAGFGGQPLTVYNISTAVVTFTNLSGSASSALDEIRMPNSDSFTLRPGGSVEFIYDDSQGYWILQQALATQGNTTNSVATVGEVGEIVSSYVANANITAITAAVTAIALTAGDWDIAVNVVYNGPVTQTYFSGFVTTTSGGGTAVPGMNQSISSAFTPNQTGGLAIPLYPVQINTTTTYYLNMFSQQDAASAISVYLVARRRR